MNLPKSELIPDDPDRLPPARRRRARRLLAPLDADERAAFLDRLVRRTAPTFDFFLFSVLAGIVLSIGLLLDMHPIIIIGAVIAPLMSPVGGVALGTVTGSVRLFSRSLVGLVIGSGIVFAMGLLSGVMAQSWLPFELRLAHQHTLLNWPDFFLLLVGAILTTGALAHGKNSAAASSVALAYALYVPLAAAGIGLGSGEPYLWPDGVVIYSLYLAWAVLFGTAVLAVLGFRPLTLFGYTLGGAVTLTGIVLMIGMSGAGMIYGTQVALPTQTPSATFTITPTLTLTPTLSPTLTSTLTPTLTQTLTPTTTPSPTFTPSPTPLYARVFTPVEYGGANLRSEPDTASKLLMSLQNGTLVQVLSDTVETDGRVWVKVSVPPDNVEGWLLFTTLALATPAPSW